MTAAVATCVERSLNNAGDVFVEIISLDVVNQGVGVHVTQPKVITVPGLHVAITKLIHDDLTQIEVGLPEIDGFVHDDLDFSHLAPHQVLTDDDSQFEVQLYHPLEIHLLVCHEIDIPMLLDVLHHLPKH